jgi:hypothetical protein
VQDIPDPEGYEAQGDALPALVDDIAARLGPVCAHLPPDEFAALVAEIAQTKIRFAYREASLPGLSGLWDPPLPGVIEQLGEREPPDKPRGPTSAR